MKKCTYCDGKLYQSHPYCTKAENLTPKQIKKLRIYYEKNVDYRETVEYKIDTEGIRVLKLKSRIIDHFDTRFMCELENCFEVLNIDYSEVPLVIEHLEKKHSDFWNDK